jgi:hypothetical protein
MEPKTFIGLGDIHGGEAQAVKIPGIGAADGIIVSGDLTNYGGPGEVGDVVASLAALNPRVVAQIGNMDQPEADAWLAEQGINMHRMLRELVPGLWLAGLGYSSTTPFNTPSEVPDQILGQWLAELKPLLPQSGRLLFVSHTPPLETATDRLAGGVHVGSAAVRQFIEEIQPDLCLTGHIHESRAVDQLGRTVIVNPGSLAEGGFTTIRFEANGLAAELGKVPGSRLS